MADTPNPLEAAFKGIQDGEPPADANPLAKDSNKANSDTKTDSSAPTRTSHRGGLVAVQGHFVPEVRKQLKLLAIELDKTQEQLVGEALNDLFRKYNKSAIS